MIPNGTYDNQKTSRREMYIGGKMVGFIHALEIEGRLMDGSTSELIKFGTLPDLPGNTISGFRWGVKPIEHLTRDELLEALIFCFKCATHQKYKVVQVPPVSMEEIEMVLIPNRRRKGLEGKLAAGVYFLCGGSERRKL